MMAVSMNYVSERGKLFTEDGLSTVLDVEKVARRHISTAGAVLSGKLLTGDSWMCLNAMDLLVERGILREVTGSQVAGQNRVFVAGNNY